MVGIFGVVIATNITNPQARIRLSTRIKIYSVKEVPFG